MAYLHDLTLNVYNPPPVWLLAEWLFPQFPVICSYVPLSLLIWGHGYVVSVVAQAFPSVWSWKLFPGCLAASASKSEVLLTNYRPGIGVITSNSTHLIIPLPSISLPPLIPPLTSGYLTAKTNCLTVGIHNSSYTLLIYTSTLLFLHAKSMQTLCCQCYTDM